MFPFPAVVTYKKRHPGGSRTSVGSHAQLFNFGPSHVPGWLPSGSGDAGLTNLPAKSGMCARLRWVTF